jgi:hypothetical protein
MLHNSVLRFASEKKKGCNFHLRKSESLDLISFLYLTYLNTLQQRNFKRLMSCSSSHSELRLRKREHDDRVVTNSLMKTAVQNEPENVATKICGNEEDGPLECDVTYLSVRVIIASMQFRVTIARKCRTRTRCVNVSYAAGHACARQQSFVSVCRV